jgi:hypothetical protein
MPTTRHWIAAVVAAISLDAAAGEYTDLWWNPRESGWGASIVQQGETAFVTLFVYDHDGKPAWYVAPAARVFAYDSGGRPALRGTLYRTRGPWQGGPFDPALVRNEPVGDMTLEPAPGGALNLHYSAEGLSIAREVVRQTFEAPAFGNYYHGSFSLRQAAPGQPPWGTRQFHGEILLHIEAGQAYLRVSGDGSLCEYRGSHSQAGKYGRIGGAYSCADGAAGTFEITDLEIAKHGISGYMRMGSADNNQYGRFGAARF